VGARVNSGVNDWENPQVLGRNKELAEGAGMLLPDGPYVVFPLIAVLYQAGAGLGAAVTLVTCWAVLSLLNLHLSDLSWTGVSPPSVGDWHWLSPCWLVTPPNS
jgi:hypothetical protein